MRSKQSSSMLDFYTFHARFCKYLGWYTYGAHFEGERGVRWKRDAIGNHANDILLARHLPFDSDVRQWSDPLMIPLHCLWAKFENGTRGHFEYEVTSVFFSFGLISFICTVRLLFHSLFTFSSYTKKIAKWAQKNFF